MDGMAAILVGVAVLALLNWIYWMVFRLTGDSQTVSFGLRAWLSYFLTTAIMIATRPLLVRLEDFAHEVGYFDGAILLYAGIAAYIGVCCLAGAVLHNFGGRSIPFRFCAVFCFLAWQAMNVSLWIKS